MRYIISNTCFAFGIPELIALLFMVGVIVVVWRKTKKLKKEHQELMDQLGAENADELQDQLDSLDLK